MTQTSQSLLIHNLKMRNSNLLPSPNSSLLTSANHPPNLACWLEQWHKLQPQQPSPPTAWWPKPWELEYPKEELPQVPKESSRPYSPHNTIEEMEVEMILLNLADEILENAWTTGKEVVKMEMCQGVVAAVEEADLIMRVMSIQPTQGLYQII